MKTRMVWACLVVLAWCMPASAWGGEGHQVVALIAETRLSERAKAGVRELLGDGVNISDTEVASWADEIRRERRETGPWHYVNVPVGIEGVVGYDAARDGKDGNTIVGQIERFERVLADRTATKEARAEALKFLVHFVGDVHQPLHCVERAGDKGGNSVLVYMPGATGRASNLHRVWDGEMLRTYIGLKPIAEYAGELARGIGSDRLALWATAKTPADWATEGWRVAVWEVYPPVPVGQVTQLSAGYVEASRPVVEQQLQKAGVRLAEVLNRAFAG
jgi:hypothetical protein